MSCSRSIRVKRSWIIHKWKSVRRTIYKKLVVWIYHPELPVPTTVIGEQVTPTGTSTPPSTTPRRPSKVLTRPELDDWTLLQHWMEPRSSILVGVVTRVVYTIGLTGVALGNTRWRRRGSHRYGGGSSSSTSDFEGRGDRKEREGKTNCDMRELHCWVVEQSLRRCQAGCEGGWTRSARISEA